MTILLPIRLGALSVAFAATVSMPVTSLAQSQSQDPAPAASQPQAEQAPPAKSLDELLGIQEQPGQDDKAA
ncbi:MAG: hypothetical protein L0Y42_10745, partial [Phycisphaerales bacterium]|nr:hypothetical protein [Phycisphaerales bacterium]